MTMNRSGHRNGFLYRIGAIVYSAGKVLRIGAIVRGGIRIKDHAWPWHYVD